MDHGHCHRDAHRNHCPAYRWREAKCLMPQTSFFPASSKAWERTQLRKSRTKSKVLWIVQAQRLPAIHRSSSLQNSNRRNTKKRRWHDRIPISTGPYSRTAPSCLPVRKKQCAQTRETAKLPHWQHESYTDFGDCCWGKLLLVWLVLRVEIANSCLGCDTAKVAFPRYWTTFCTLEISGSAKSVLQHARTK